MSATHFFRTEERIAHLLFSAERLRGTPWVANSSAPGHGMSCHNEPRWLFIECGGLPESFPIVKGDPNGSRHSKVSEMDKFLDARPEFSRLKTSAAGHWTLDLIPGDLLGLRIYHCCDHLGVYLGNGVFIHVLMHKKTDFDLIHVPPWQQRIVAAWRLLEKPL